MKRINTKWMLTAVLGGSTLMGAFALAENRDTGLTMNDQKVLKELHHGNQMEVEMGTLASANSQDSKVKDYGSKMVKDHGDLDKDLLNFAMKHQVVLTETARDLKMEQKEMAPIAHLKGLTGTSFDKAYMNSMLKDHDKDIQQVTTAMSETNDKDVKKLLDHTLSVMKDHQKLAADWMKKVGSRARSAHMR